MSRTSRFFVLFAAALLLSLNVMSAFAAPAEWQSVDVTLQSEQQQSLLLVSGELSPDAKLPAEAELAVPTGTQLHWIGEILGGDPSKDPELQYTKSSSNGMDVYRFTLTKARVAQVEGTAQSVTSFDGTNYVTGLRWTTWQTVPEVRISQRIPQGARIVQAAPGASVQEGSPGYSYYTKTVQSPKAGDVLDLTFSYTLPAAGAASTGGTGGAGADTLILAAIMVIAIGGFGLLAFNVNRKMAAKAGQVELPQRNSQKPTGQSARIEVPESDAQRFDPETGVEAQPPRRRKPVVPMLVVIGVFIIGFIIAGTKGTSAAVVDGKISRNFGAPSACQSASIPFTANEGVDLTRQGDQLFKGFEGMEGVGEISVDLAQSKIDMSWCESSQSEESMRQVLAMTGLVTLGQGVSSPTTVRATVTVDQ